MAEVTSPTKGLGKMTVAQLKAELSAKGLDLTGKKVDLIQRLADHMEAGDDAGGEKNEENQKEKGI